MRKMIIIGCTIAVSAVLVAEAAHAGDSAPLLIDTRMGVRESTGDETLTYSSLWDGGDGATVTIAQDGTALFEGLTGAGERAWSVQKAGTYTLTHTTYTNGVAGKVETATFRLTKDIASLTVGNIAGVTYTGSALTPHPVVTDDVCGYTLVKDTDYTLSYVNNVNAGEATVTVAGKGNYTGTASKTFTIARRDIADAVVTLGVALTYNGGEQTQTISSVKADNLTVTYTVSGNTATDAGNYTLTVTGTGNFTGTATKQFTIARKSIAGATVTLGSALTYTGSAQSQGVSAVTIGGLNATFDVSGNSATAAGNYTLTVTGTGNFTGSTTKQFTVAPKPLTAAMVGGVGNVSYSGSAHTPEPVVTDSARGVTLAKGTDYTLSYANNKDAGTATVTVTGKGNYTGAIPKNFTIGKQVVAAPTIAGKAYTGGQQVATVASSTLYDIVQNAGGVDVGQYDVKLRLVDSSNYTWPGVAGTDLTLKFSITKADNIWLTNPSIANWTYGQAASAPNMGTAKFGTATVTYGASGATPPADAGSHTATFTVAGTANYEGLSLPVGFTIARKSIAGATVTLGSTLVYNGSPQTQTVTGVMVDGLNATYTVSGNTATDEGAYTLTVTGTGNFTGTATAQWRIHPDGIVEQVTPYDGIYDGEGHGIEVNVTKPDGAAVKYALDENGPYAADAILFTNVTEGAIAVWYIVEAENYTTVTNFGTVKISPKTLTDAMVTVAASVYVYDGNAKEPTVTVADGDPSILVESDYDMAYSGNMNAGEATVTVTGKGNYTGTVVKHFEIDKATYDMSGATWSYSSPFTYDGQAHSVTLSGLPSGVTVKSYSNNSKTAAGSYNATATFNYDSTNYNAPSVPGCSWSISRRDIADASVTLGGALTYNGQAQSQAVSGVTVGGLAVTYTVSGNTATDAGNYTLTVTGTGNFTGAATKQFSIARKLIAGATVTLAGGLTYTGSAQSQVVSAVTIGGLNATFDVSDNTSTAAGNYTLTVTGTGNFTGSTTKQFTVAPKPLTAAMVGAVGNVTYTGSAFTPEPTVTDAARGVTLTKGTDYTLSYANNKNAGTATVTVTGKGNYTGAIPKNFTIGTQPVPPPVIASREYTGGQQVATVASSTLYDIVQNAGGVDVGQYDVKLRLVDSSNYTWPGVAGTDLTLKFSITKATNTWTVEPSIVGWTYGQAASVPNMGAAKFGTATVSYGATGASCPTYAGDYTATFTVAGTANYTGLSEPVHFTISKATYNMSGAKWDYPGAFTYDGGVKSVGVSGLPLGVTVASYSGNTAVLSGTYTAHAVLAYDTVNYNAPTLADLVWEIKLGDQSKIEDAFEDLPVTIGPDGAGGWTVKLTNDVDSADLPLEIPDNLGPITIDLGGHDLIGANGADGDDATPGGAGSPAIRIVPGEGGGDATRLTLVTTGGDSLVRGGDGGAGNPGGDGAPAIVVSAGCQGSVLVDVGAGVTVQGGTGGSSTTGRGGDGGSGIDGSVGTNDGTIIGGNGGGSVSGDGGNGGPGVDGDVDVNNGSITGGDGGASDAGRGGAGGIGVTGNVGRNDGAVSGGAGGVSAQGENGHDGKAVGGTVGGGTGTLVKVNVPVPEVPSAEYTGEEVSPQVPESPLYAVSVSGGTRPGSYPVMLTLLDAANYEWIPREGATVNGALAVVNFVISNPPPRIETEGGGKQGRENAASVAAVYDGAGHGISVNVTYPASGATIRYARTADGPFSDGVPLFTNVVDGAETWYELSAAGFDPVTNMATVTIAPRSLAAAALGTIRFETSGGVRTPVPTLVDDLGHEVPPSDYAFTWTEEDSGAMTLSFTGCGNYLGLFEKRLAQTRFRVAFDVSGGEVATKGEDFDIGTYYGALPVPSRAGYLFDGWYESADFSGEPVTRNTEVIAADLTLHAKWLRRALWYTDSTFHLNGAATYDGYLIDPAADDVVAGTISVKAGKPDGRGMSKLTVTIEVAGERKIALKGSTFDGVFTAAAGDGRVLDLKLGVSALSGRFGRYVLDGARNLFAAKDDDSRLRAAQALKRWQGTYVVAWCGDGGWTGLSIDVGAKGAMKVAGNLADGSKVSAKGRLLVGERECALAVSWTKKAASVACLIWFCEDGTMECGNLPGGVSAIMANARTGSQLAGGSAFRIASGPVAEKIPGLLAGLLPDGVEVRMKGMAFDIDKAGKVRLLKDKSGIDTAALGTNPSGLKLKYTVKNGTFKGTFNAYTHEGGKLKKLKVQVTGVVLGGKGYGTASIKKPTASWPVTLE